MKSALGNRPWWQIDVGAVVIFGILTSIGYAVVVQPLASGRLELAALRGKLIEAQRLAAESDHDRNTLTDELGHVQRELNAIPVRLEPVDELNRRLAKIVEQAVAAGLTIHETRSADVETGLRYSTVPVTLAGSGSYPACAEFLHRLYEHAPDVEVIGFDLNGQPDRLGVPVGFRFDLAWYAASSVVSATESE